MMPQSTYNRLYDASINARTAKQRAKVAARVLMTARPIFDDLGRAFDNCFEAGDGSQVVRELIDIASRDNALRHRIVEHGCGAWLEPGYLDAA